MGARNYVNIGRLEAQSGGLQRVKCNKKRGKYACKIGLLYRELTLLFDDLKGVNFNIFVHRMKF